MSFSDLKIPKDAIVQIKEKTLYITKWDWNYLECLEFQKEAQRLVLKDRSRKVYIFTNHPHCFTLGRGNERGDNSLESFNESIIPTLLFPIHKVHRGGGITFHYPGQWIFYPICSISPSYTLDQHMCWMLGEVRDILKNDFNIQEVITAKKLMGIWHQKRKLASIGVGVNRFVTEHGLALNINYDEKMFSELEKISPCGMNHSTYMCIDQLISNDNILDEFHSLFLRSVL